MRKCFFLAAAAFVIALNFVPARAQNLPWLSPQRFSLSLSSTYFFDPWDNYNDALETVSERIRLDRFFVEPTGHYEEINGNLAFQAALSYQVIGRVAARVLGEYSRGASTFEFYPNPEAIEGFVFSPAFHQELDWDFWSAGLGASYLFPLTKTLSLSASAEMAHYTIHLNLSWRHEYGAAGPVPEDSGEMVAASLEDDTWGGTLALTAQWQFAGSFTLLAGVDYRAASFNQLEGPATYRAGSFDHADFTAELVEAPNYFGVRVKEQVTPAFQIYLPPLTFLTSPDESARAPAKIDLSSFGLTLGIQFGF